MKTWLAVLAIGFGVAHADGHEPGPIARYERAYLETGDAQILPRLASEYRLANMPREASDAFCRYLAAQPKGPQAPYAATQVIALRRELGLPVANVDVCAAPKPVRVDTAPRRKHHALPTLASASARRRGA